MHLQTKLELMKHTDSYWMILPPAIRELILKYKESQELIEWRESDVSRALCQQIVLYRQLQLKWFIGTIRCQCIRMRDEDVIEMRVYGHYWNLNGENKHCFLGYDLEGAIAYCGTAKDGMWFQMNPLHLIRLLSEAR